MTYASFNIRSTCLEISEWLIEHRLLSKHHWMSVVIMLWVSRQVGLGYRSIGWLKNLEVEVLNLIDHCLRRLLTVKQRGLLFNLCLLIDAWLSLSFLSDLWHDKLRVVHLRWQHERHTRKSQRRRRLGVCEDLSGRMLLEARMQHGVEHRRTRHHQVTGHLRHEVRLVVV